MFFFFLLPKCKRAILPCPRRWIGSNFWLVQKHSSQRNKFYFQDGKSQSVVCTSKELFAQAKERRKTNESVKYKFEAPPKLRKNKKCN